MFYILRLILMLLFAVVSIFFAIANRQFVTIYLEPTPFVIDMPVFLVVFGSMAVSAIFFTFFYIFRNIIQKQKISSQAKKIQKLEAQIVEFATEKLTKD